MGELFEKGGRRLLYLPCHCVNYLRISYVHFFAGKETEKGGVRVEKIAAAEKG